MKRRVAKNPRWNPWCNRIRHSLGGNPGETPEINHEQSQVELLNKSLLQILEKLQVGILEKSQVELKEESQVKLLKEFQL